MSDDRSAYPSGPNQPGLESLVALIQGERTLIVNIVDAWLCAQANPAATLTPLGR